MKPSATFVTHVICVARRLPTCATHDSLACWSTTVPIAITNNTSTLVNSAAHDKYYTKCDRQSLFAIHLCRQQLASCRWQPDSELKVPKSRWGLNSTVFVVGEIFSYLFSVVGNGGCLRQMIDGMLGAWKTYGNMETRIKREKALAFDWKLATRVEKTYVNVKFSRRVTKKWNYIIGITGNKEEIWTGFSMIHGKK